VMDEIDRAGLRNTALQTHFPVITKTGVNDFGKTVRYVFNYSSQPATSTYNGGGGTDLLARREIADGEKLTLGSWDLVVIEEK
jgi:beta-galactosidase